MNSATNFKIWLNLVKMGQIVDYENGLTMHERGKEELKKSKIEIIKSYFNNVDDNHLKELIKDKEENLED